MIAAHNFPTDPAEIAERIDIPLDRWPGNCHGIAEAILRHLPIEGMRLCRGHYDGYVSRKSVYHQGGMQQHSWLRLQDGRILDPTRWAIDRPEAPYLYIGENDHYDEAGQVAKARTRPMTLMSIGVDMSAPDRFIAEKLTQAPEALRYDLADLTGIQGLAETDINIRNAERLRRLIEGPVEHLQDPAGLYALIDAAGLKALVKMDVWTRVMEPEKVTPAAGTNFFYEAPAREELSEMEILFRVFAKFLSIDERDIIIEDELEEYGYKLDDLHDAINDMESMVKIDPALPWMDSGSRDLLCVVASDLLGKGFGEELRVERFADSLGMDRQALHRSMIDFGRPAGFDLAWLMPDEVIPQKEITPTFDL